MKRRPARLAKGEDLVGLCVHGEGQAVRMECEKVRVTAADGVGHKGMNEDGFRVVQHPGRFPSLSYINP